MTELLAVSVFGLLIGSFLNVCIWRLPRQKSVLRPHRSHCPKCDAQLSSLDNIPLISWVLLKGKCRHCGEPISGRYPLVELLSAIGAAMSYIHFGGITPTSVVVYTVTASLIVITFIDLDFQIIPDVISIPGTIIGYILAVVVDYTDIFDVPILYSEPMYRGILTTGVIDSLIGSFSGAGFFLGVLYLYYYLTGKIGLGLGDVKLMALLGAVFGWRCIMPVIFAGSLLGSFFGVLLMVLARSGRHTEIAFGPWLALGALVYIFTDIPFLRFPIT